ncbi:thiamine-phosphate diphosphorylase [Eubacterium uniforme]|uniref:Thiamine-phosphate synthase n=1 Tax=Eubacterium uniforme TaxID=39495 RepID=A0A1T4V9G6_9FIRM|nr:thiamine phosphate synthase [Eubacterium uniforme]SKA61594.1 thiamine-phosphate diphosphorylase [Eubacterium uniforme]
MNVKKEDMLLYGITDRSWLNGRTLSEVVKESLEGGVTILQIREKDIDEKNFLEEAKEIKKICEKFNVPLIINDNVEIAKMVDADGVHLGQDDMDIEEARKILGPEKIIGITAKTIEQAKEAQMKGADYLGSGAIYTSGTKQNAKRLTVEDLKAICASVEIPVVAIGGLTYDNIDVLKDSGISGIAVVSAIYASTDIKTDTIKLKEKTRNLIDA